MACFFLSGFAALLYETAWTRELAFLFGTSEIAIAAVLGAYMGGLALGAALAARLAPRARRPVLVYGTLELAIALSALALPFGLSLVNWAYAGLFGGAPAPPPAGAALATAFQLAAAFLLLLVPTSCMGATLPLLARQAVESDSQVGPRVGALYATNTAGAISGVVVAGFLLLPEIGLRRTVWVGVAANLAVFGVACLIGRSPAGVAPTDSRRAAYSWVLPVIALSGAVSFAYEVMWIRLLVYQLGSSIYAFATMLGSFLAGIALGGALAAPIARRRQHAASGFVVAEVAVGLLGFAAFAMADRLPALARSLGWQGQADLAGNALLCAALLVPLATAMGATFPFAVRLAARSAEDAPSASARVFAWNTVGSIAGSLGGALFFLPYLGFEGTTQLGVVVNLALAGIAASMIGRRRLAAAVALCVGVAAITPPPLPSHLFAQAAMTGNELAGEQLYFGVGRGATVRLSRAKEGLRLFTNGLPESVIATTDSPPVARRVTDWMGLLPTLLRPASRSMLVVGLGGGTILEAVPPSIESIDVIEIEEEVVEANRRASPERVVDPLRDPRVRIYINDARGALVLSKARYDGIVAQASHPWTAGSSHLYTREFFELAKRRLTPDGVFVQWMGLRFVNESLLKSLLRTMATVFPHVVLFNPGPGGVLFVGSNEPLPVISDAAVALERYGETLGGYGIFDLEDVAAALALDEKSVAEFSAGAEINTDDHNLLAARSVRVRADHLALSFPSCVQPFDPLPRTSGGLRGVRIVRALVELNELERAKQFAEALAEGDREIALGWIQYAAGRPRRARWLFQYGLGAGGDRSEGQAGLALVTTSTLPGELEGHARTVAQARLLSFDREWKALALLDDDLASIAIDEALFLEASRLRARWRMEAGRKREAAEILATSLSRGAPSRHYKAVKRLWLRATKGA